MSKLTFIFSRDLNPVILVQIKIFLYNFALEVQILVMKYNFIRIAPTNPTCVSARIYCCLKSQLFKHTGELTTTSPLLKMGSVTKTGAF